ncbi:MAG: isoprenylcysteine carboxylmethyltransferase family protein [Verrucomicrobiota bacterium]|nr:isoprenylcysteine carboxylmethyltransferase family protein [Verrucomicrobiota bacterium]
MDGYWGWMYGIGLGFLLGMQRLFVSDRDLLKSAETRQEPRQVHLGMGVWGLAQTAALLYWFTNWVAWANFPLPSVTRRAGVLFLLAGLGLLAAAHVQLGRFWSTDLRLTSDQVLVQSGVYATIRHPMYAAHWLWAIGQTLMVHNWLGGPLALVGLGLLYAGRVGREEALLQTRFGAEYDRYRERTGRLIPRWASRRTSSPKE